MKLIRRLLFAFFLISSFSNLHNLNASAPGPMKAAGGAGGGTDWMPQELTYETVKDILDTQDITGWNDLLENYGISTIQNIWRAGNRTESMLDYCWKLDRRWESVNKKTGVRNQQSRAFFNLISQAMTSNELIKDAIHMQDLDALRDAICNVFGECDTSRPSIFESRMPSYREYEEALMRWSIEYPNILPQGYILKTYDESVLDPRKNPEMKGIFTFFNSYGEANTSFAAIAANRLGIIYKNIRTAINLQNLELLQIYRINYGLKTIVTAWKKNYPGDESPALYAMNNGIVDKKLLGELALYSNAFYTYGLPEPLVEKTKGPLIDLCASIPAEDEIDDEMVAIMGGYEFQLPCIEPSHTLPIQRNPL